MDADQPVERQIDRRLGRAAFGADPSNYHSARPPYPEALWKTLRARGLVREGIDILEIGAGTGLATAALLGERPNRLVAIEPDQRLADFLRADLPDPRLKVVVEPFEETTLPPGSFDLVASGTAFHWLDPVPAIRRIRDLLRPKGALAIWWNVFGDPERPDPFHDATTHLFAGHRDSPSNRGPGRRDFALDQETRLRELDEGGFLTEPPYIWRWTLSLDPAGVRALYATYSNVSTLPAAEREFLLDSLSEVAAGEFAGRVDRNMTTVLYAALKA